LVAIRNWPSSYIVVLWIFAPPLIVVLGTTLLVRLTPRRLASHPASGGTMASWAIPESWVVLVLALALVVPGLLTLWWWRARVRPSKEDAAA
jgi:hypothetical protein